MKCYLKIKGCNFPNKSSDIKYAYKYGDGKKKYRYLECKKCFLSFNEILQKPRIEINKYLKSLYTRDYFISSYTKQKKNDEYSKRKIQYNLDKKIILKYFKDNKTKKILDYGCGNGEFLNLFKSKKFGFEFNQDVDFKKGINYLNSNEIKNYNYDLVIMRGVIEHIPDFNLILKKIFKQMKKNSLFFITATPNNLTLPYFVDKKKFNQNSDRHIYHFNHLNLGYFFLKNNFTNLDITFLYFDTPYKNIKNDFNQMKLNRAKKLPPHVGNMMTLIFRKM